MAIHNVTGKATIVGPFSVSPETKLVNFLQAEENRALSSLFYLGGLTRLYEDFDLISQGIAMAEGCLANGQQLQDADPATIIKEAKIEQKRVKEFIDLVIKACPLEVEIERNEDDPEGSTKGA